LIIQWNKQTATDKRHFAWLAFGQPALNQYISKTSGAPVGVLPWNALSGESGITGGGDIDGTLMLSKLLAHIIGSTELKFGSASATAANAVVTITGIADRGILVNKITWSYSSTPTGGRLTISDGTRTLDVDITAGGPGALNLNWPGIVGATVIITLFSGGGGITGKLNVQYTVET